jgi:hypothetical protein
MKLFHGPVVTNCKNSFILCVGGMSRPLHEYVLVEIIGPASRFFLASAMVLASGSTFSPAAWSADLESPKNSPEVKQGVSGSSNFKSLLEDIGAQSLTFFGATMEDAANSHFLERFAFRPYAFSVTDDGFTEVFMRLPRLKQGRPFVTLTFVLDQSGKIIRSKMILKRRYISDKIHSAFARDYAKSFVQGAVSFESQERVETLADEILYRQQETLVKNLKAPDSKSTVQLKEGDIIISGAAGKAATPPVLPNRLSDMYRSFNGENKFSKLQLDDAVLKFSNEKVDDEDALVISVESKGFEHPEGVHQIVDFENLPMHVPAI